MVELGGQGDRGVGRGVRVVTPPTISSVCKRPGLRERVGVLWEQFAERIGILTPLPPEATVQTEKDRA